MVDCLALIISIITVVISIIVFIYQYHQNYINHIFQMINTFNNHYNSLSYSTKKRINGFESINHLESNDVIKYIFRKVVEYDMDEETSKHNFATPEEKFKYLINLWKKIKLSHIDNLVQLVLVINNYNDRGFFTKIISYLYNTDSFNYPYKEFLPNKFINDYNIIKSFFSNMIYKEFKLLVILLNEDNPKEIYKKFLSIKYFGALKDEDFSYFLSDSNEYHIFIKGIVEKAMKEFNNKSIN